MKNSSLQPFILPAAIVIGALVVGGAIYMNSPNRMATQGYPTPSATAVPTTTTPSVTALATPTPTATASVTPTPDDAVLLKAAVLKKSGIPANKFEYSLGSNNGSLARGSVNYSGEMSGAAWFAGKVKGIWVVSYIGQGVPTCTELGSIPYPTSWLSHCVNAKGDTVAR